MRSLALLFSAAAALRREPRRLLRARRLRAPLDGAAPSPVSGRVYDDVGAGGPSVVRLFTKPGCTLCDDATCKRHIRRGADRSNCSISAAAAATRRMRASPWW